MQVRPVADITSYHAHIYFTPETRPEAALLREAIAERFSVRLGRWQETPVGPHDAPMYQVAFLIALLPSFVPWLMLNHGHLSVLIHPNTGNGLKDHVHHAIWIGPRLAIRSEALSEDDEVTLELEPNTAPHQAP